MDAAADSTAESPAETPRVATALARLRAAGERLTPARVAVLRVLDAADAADEHLTAEQVGARVAAVEPSVHRATVYRTLTALTGTGVLTHVHLGGQATVYHLSAHAHVQCSVCGRVQDAPHGLLDDASRRLLDELGFALDGGHAALLGTCADCRASRG